MGPTLEARLYTLKYFRCVPSTRRMRRSLLSTPYPLPTGAVACRMRWSLLTSSSTTVCLMPTPSPTRVVARRTRRKFYYSLRLLLVPTLVREIIILFGIYMSFSTPSIYIYKATIKNTFCIYTRPQIVIETKLLLPPFQFMAQFQNLSNQGRRWVVELISYS